MTNETTDQLELPSEWESIRLATIEHYIAVIISSLQRCWSGISVTEPNEHENPITQRLTFILQNDRALRTVSVRVFPQHQTVISPSGKFNVIDLHFQLLIDQGFDEFIWFECKRLCCRIGSDKRCKFRGADYVDGDNQGMTAFTSGRYAAPRGHAGMLGYVLCAPPSDDIVASLEDSIEAKKDLLHLGEQPHLIDCSYAKGHPLVKTSWHCEDQLQIHHVILVAS